MHCLRTELHEIEKIFFWFLVNLVSVISLYYVHMSRMQYHSIQLNLILSIMLIGFTLSIINFLSCFMFFPNFSSTIDIFKLNYTSYEPVFFSFLFLSLFLLFSIWFFYLLSPKSYRILIYLIESYFTFLYLTLSYFISSYCMILYILLIVH